MRTKAINRFWEFAIGSPCPELWTVYPDEGMPIRCMIAGEKTLILKIKREKVLVCRPSNHKKWSETTCKHEWTVIGHRESGRIKFRLWYCDECAAIGPRKVQTFSEVAQRCSWLPLEAMRQAGMTKKGPLVSEV